jgi:predicted Zn-dependent protease
MSVQPNLGPERKLKIAKVLNWCNQKDDTFNILHRLKKQYPAFIPARIYLARIHTWNRDFLSAQIEYENILKHSPNRHRLRTELVNVLYWQHKYMEAQKELLTIPSEKRSQEINTLLGELYMVNHDFAAAEELYRNKLHADPDNHSVRVKLAQVLSWNNKLNEAIAEYKILVNNLPHDRQLRRHYAMVLSWANQPIEAARQLKLTL